MVARMETTDIHRNRQTMFVKGMKSGRGRGVTEDRVSVRERRMHIEKERESERLVYYYYYYYRQHRSQNVIDGYVISIFHDIK